MKVNGMPLFLAASLVLAGCIGEDASFCQPGKTWSVGNGDSFAQGKVVGMADYNGARYCHASITAGGKAIDYYFKANETETYAIEKQGGQILEVHTLQKNQAAFCPEKRVEVKKAGESALTTQNYSAFNGTACCMLEESINAKVTQRSCQSQDKQFTLLESYANGSVVKTAVQEGRCTTLIENGNLTKNCLPK